MTKATKLASVTAWVLLGVIVVIVVAPSVDLDSTTLRTSHSADALLTLALACLILLLKPGMVKPHRFILVRLNCDVINLDCVRRC
jgi:hypothetical protein